MHLSLQVAAQILFSWGATYLLHSTVVIVLVWSFLKLRPTTGHDLRDLLWKTALVGGLVTTGGQFILDPHHSLNLITWSLSVAPIDSSFDVDAKHHEANSTTKLIPDADLIDPHSNGENVDSIAEVWIVAAPVDLEPSGGAMGIDQIDSSKRPTAEPLTKRPNTRDSAVSLAARLPGILSLAAAFAMFLGFVRHAWQTYRLSRRLAECRPVVAGPARQLLDELLRQTAQSPSVTLVEGNDDFEPAALGIWRSTIILPRRATHELSNDELQSLLAHELAHLIRGDALWLAIHRLFGTLLAFQPLNRLVRREWQRAAEFLCDRWAIDKTGQPLALARCLTEVASWRIGTRAPQASLAAVGRRSGLVERIENLLDWTSRSDDPIGRRRRQRVVAALLVGLAALTGAVPRIVVVSAHGVASKRQDVAGHEPQAKNASDLQAQTPVDDSEKGGDLAEHEEAREAIEAGADRQLDDGRTKTSVSLSTRNLIHELEREIAGLENELAALAQMLDEKPRHSDVKSLLPRLREELSRLKKRRADLLQREVTSIILR